MANFIPMVSSSPPPMDDGGFGWDDDDDEFGTFTGADDSVHLQSVPDPASSGQHPDNQDSSLSSSSSEKQDPPSWHQNNNILTEKDVNEHVDNDFAVFPNDLNTKEIDVSIDKCDLRPNKIDIDQDPANEFIDTNVIGKADKVPLTDSGLYSADVSPVPQCSDGDEDSKEHGNSDSLEEISTGSSPVSADMITETQVISNEVANESEDAGCHLEVDSQILDNTVNTQQVQKCDEIQSEHISRHCSDDEIVNRSDLLEHKDQESEDCSPVGHDQCDKDTVLGEDRTEGSLVTIDVQKTAAQDQKSDESSDNFSKSPTEVNKHFNETETENAAVNSCESTGSLDQDDVCDSVAICDQSDSRKANEMNSPPLDHQEVDVSVQSPLSNLDEDKSVSPSDVSIDNSGEFGSAAAECATVNDSNDLTDDISGNHEIQSDKVNDEFGDFSEAGSVSNVGSKTESTDDWGEFGTVSTITENTSVVPVANRDESKLPDHKPVTDIPSEDPQNSHSQGGNELNCVEKVSDEVKQENTNHSSSTDEIDNIDSSENKPSVSVTSSNKQDGSESFAAFGSGEDCEFGDFNSPDDFGDFNDADDFDSFNHATDIGNNYVANDSSKIDTSQAGFAAFGESSDVADTGDSQNTDDWAAFSEPQTVEVTKEDEEDEWAAFNEEPVQAPPASKTMAQKMSQQEKVLFAVTTVFPCEMSATSTDAPVTDLDDVVSDKAALQREVNVWLQIKGIHMTNAVTYQYVKSQWNDRLFTTLQVDTRNVFIGHKKAPVPIFASGLTMLEPTKGSPVALQPDVLVDTSKISSAVPQSQEAIPPAQFDWSSSGLRNPLEADNKTLNLDFLIQDQAVKSNALESEFLGSEAFEPLKKPSLQPLENILANMKSVSTLKPINQQENVSKEVLKVVNALPDLSFMKSKVLMFPLKLDQ